MSEELNRGNNVNNEIKVQEQNNVIKMDAKEHRRLKPWIKWTLIGIGGVAVIGGAVFLIVKGANVPTETVAEAATKVAEAAAETATAAV